MNINLNQIEIKGILFCKFFRMNFEKVFTIKQSLKLNKKYVCLFN